VTRRRKWRIALFRRRPPVARTADHTCTTDFACGAVGRQFSLVGTAAWVVANFVGNRAWQRGHVFTPGCSTFEQMKSRTDGRTAKWTAIVERLAGTHRRTSALSSQVSAAGTPGSELVDLHGMREVRGSNAVITRL
jgi:hypothetical protein